MPLLTSEGIWKEDPDLLIRALLEMDHQNVDFVDALLAELARRSGESVYSFDKDFEQLGTRCVEP